MTLPTLTTERLLLRERSLSDTPAYLEMDADPQVMRYVGDGRVPDPATYPKRQQQRIAEGSTDGLGVWLTPDEPLGPWQNASLVAGIAGLKLSSG